MNHIIVMGHYGCGGVAASIASPPANQVDAANGAVQNWIRPLRELFQSSSRAEIVELRTKLQGQKVIEEPDIKERKWNALSVMSCTRQVNHYYPSGIPCPRRGERQGRSCTHRR